MLCCQLFPVLLPASSCVGEKDTDQAVFTWVPEHMTAFFQVLCARARNEILNSLRTRAASLVCFGPRDVAWTILLHLKLLPTTKAQA